MAENKTIQDKDLDMPCKHKNHTSLKHVGLKLACQDSSCKRPLSLPRIAVGCDCDMSWSYALLRTFDLLNSR